MPQELPGFYFDAEKNRYFPIKGPIPGTSRSSSKPAQKPHSKPTQAIHSCKARTRTSKLLQFRELNGNVLSLTKGKCNFVEEFQKRLASQPVVWKYRGTNKIGDGALEQICLNVQTPEGQIQTDALLAGGVNGSLSFFEVGKVGQHSDNGVKCIPDRVWPLVKVNKTESYEEPEQIWGLYGASIQMSSSVSCIKVSGKHSPCTTDDGSNPHHAMITTLGSETSGGSVFLLVDSSDFDPSSIIRQRINQITSLDCTIWTADCNSNANRAVIGTNRGAAAVSLETGAVSWACRSKSDVLAQQLDNSGNVVLCGLRNGAILTVDVRERQEGFSTRLIRHRIAYSPLHSQSSDKKLFEVRGNVSPSRTIFMPSSVSCLVSLRQFYDQYFLASSMDGSVKLYDQRLIKRGAVQSYEGHANSHTRVQLGVDQSERFMMSGGEDCNLRIWSIKSGELLFEDKFSNSVPSTVCWGRPQRFTGCESWPAWVGTEEGLFNMHWS